MQKIREILTAEKRRMSRLAAETGERLKTAPEGSLHVSTSQKHTQFYHYLPGETGKNGVYISKKENELIRELAQKGYDEKILKIAEKRERQLTELLKNYRDDEIEQVFLGEPAAKKPLIHPVEPTWEQQLSEWKAIPFQGKGFSETDALIITEKGERVRSKSEKIIADFLFRNDIPYKYECPLFLKGFGTVYPDFTILSGKTGQEIYLEHEGMMDDPEYAEKAIRKISTYGKNGFFPGERLILSFETSHTVIDVKTLEAMLQHVL